MNESVTRADLERMESKLDKMADGIARLILIEDRQSSQIARTDKLENRVSLLEAAYQTEKARVSRWINRGIGAWAVAVLVCAIVTSSLGLKLFRLVVEQ